MKEIPGLIYLTLRPQFPHLENEAGWSRLVMLTLLLAEPERGCASRGSWRVGVSAGRTQAAPNRQPPSQGPHTLTSTVLCEQQCPGLEELRNFLLRSVT